MGTRSAIAPMCILVKDHNRVLCEQLQQLRLQSGLVDLDIVCEDHHINVHKVVMAACSKFFKDQLCKVNVQVWRRSLTRPSSLPTRCPSSSASRTSAWS